MARKIKSKNPLNLLHRALGRRCYLCGNHLNMNDMTKDHVFPKSLGFGLSNNMMPAHQHCNADKENRVPCTTEIELAIKTYDAIGKTFWPTIINEKPYISLYFSTLVKQLETSK